MWFTRVSVVTDYDGRLEGVVVADHLQGGQRQRDRATRGQGDRRLAETAAVRVILRP